MCAFDDYNNEPNLNGLQKAIIDFLIEKQDHDITQEEIIGALDKGSRVTIRKEIRNLVDYQIVGIDKKFSHRHRVFLRTDSEIMSIMKKFLKLEKTFSNLIEEAKPLFDDISKLEEDFIDRTTHWVDLFDMPEEVVYKSRVQDGIRVLFTHMVGIYMLYFLFEWPAKVRDIRAREKLYSIAFDKLKKIQIKLLQLFSLPMYEQEKNRGKTVNDFFILKGETLFDTAIQMEHLGLGKAGEAVLDTLWNFSSPFVIDALIHPYSMPDPEDYLKENEDNAMRILKDWRVVVKTYSNSNKFLPPGKKKWARSVTDKY